MEVIKYSGLKDDHYPACALTWGMFDGLHMGHRRIFDTLLAQARDKGIPPVAMTFEPHPREVLGKAPHVPEIVPLAERCRLIEDMGVDALVIIEFTKDFASRTAEGFFEELVRKIHPQVIVIGHDFRFGRDREGDESLLLSHSRQHGYQIFVVPAVTVSGEVVSSSGIRELIQSGDMEKAAQHLGRPFSVEGKVIHGHHRGKKMGFATANLLWEAELIPKIGVYVARVEFNGETYPAVVNVGMNPTFMDDKISIEAYLLDFEGNLYDKRLRIFFLKRLRDEIRFDSAETLAAQIEKDIKATRIYMEKAE